MTKPTPTDAMFKPGYDGERRERLLTGNLTLLMALEANGLEKPAAALIEKIGAGLARRPASKSEPERRVALPDAERGRNAADLAALDVLNARLSRPYKAKGGETAEDRREADLKRRVELEHRLATEREKRANLEAMARADLLAAGRGETVAVDHSGVRRILDHDPIASLTWLTADQDAAAKELRDAYDLRAADAGAQEYDGMPTAGHDHERFIANRHTRAKATVLIGQVATAILVGQFRSVRGSAIVVQAHARFEREKVQPHLALRMVQAVCGQGVALSSLGAGRAYARNRAALALGLDVAHEVAKG